MPAKEDEDPHSAHYLPSTFLPIPQRRITEEEAIQLSAIQGNTYVHWPSTTGSALNECTTEGYMFCAFPILFRQAWVTF